MRAAPPPRRHKPSHQGHRPATRLRSASGPPGHAARKAGAPKGRRQAAGRLRTGLRTGRESSRITSAADPLPYRGGPREGGPVAAEPKVHLSFRPPLATQGGPNHGSACVLHLSLQIAACSRQPSTEHRRSVMPLWCLAHVGAEGPSARKRTVTTCMQCHGYGWSDQEPAEIPALTSERG